ncbi:MAG: hypothetical protein ACTSQK_02790 [Candidatus Heimdallarchaeota archaeon]
MIENIPSSNNSIPKAGAEFYIYKNKRSKMDESILVQHFPENKSYSLHVYSIVLLQTPVTKMGKNEIDLRKKVGKDFQNPLSIIGNQKKGSLSFTRFFINNPEEKKYLEKLKEKYPNKKNIKSKVHFFPLLVLVANYCDYYNYTDEDSNIEELIQESLTDFDIQVQEYVHQTLRVIGSPLYLKGYTSLLNFHISREIPKSILVKLTETKKILATTQLSNYTVLGPVVKGMRKEISEQKPFFNKFAEPTAITHLLNSNDKLLSISEEQFPIIVVGEANTRRNIIFNMLNNLNSRFLLLDPEENYGKFAENNSRVRGYLLGQNFMLNIIGTEGDNIREQVYAYWFAKIIAYIAGLRTELEKTLETYLLGAYKDPNNQIKTEIQFQRFANQEITSEVTKMGRNEASVISNVLYPLGTYDEISLVTRIGRSNSLESLFDTKGSLIQFAKDDEQLTRIAYLFTLLKLRSIQNDDPKILILENLDSIIGSESWKGSDLSNLILGLMDKYHLIIGVRSPSKVKEIFKNTKTKFINRLLIPADLQLLEKEYNISNSELTSLKQFSDREFFALLPEFSSAQRIKVDSAPNIKMKVKIDKLERESTQRILKSENYLRRDGIPPETQKALFELIRNLRDKPRKMLPVEGIERLISNCSEVDVLRAKEIALSDAFITLIESSPDDSEETIILAKLTELGEEYYKSYLDLQEKMPKISLKSLASEKDFEAKIFAKLSSIKEDLVIDNFKKALEEMLEVAVRLLAVLPESERFVSGKITSKLLDHWSYLSSLKATGNEKKVKRQYQEFSQIVTNALKNIKHDILDKKGIFQEREAKSGAVQHREKKAAKKQKSDDFEFDFDFIKNEKDNKAQPKPQQNEETENSSVERESSSRFLAATDDLRSAGLAHLNSNGDIFEPVQENNKNDTLEKKKPYDPFESKSKDKSVIDIYFDQQKNEVTRVKKLLIKQLTKKLELEKIDDVDFVWHCLHSRFSGNLDDGYTISEVVTILKKLESEVESEALISDETIKRLEKLIMSSKLIDENLKIDLRQYLAEQ